MGSLLAIGFTHDITEDLFGLLFDEEKVRQSRGFTEIWERDTSLESVSTRRQHTKFGWSNKPE
jgi:hypothetical protein